MGTSYWTGDGEPSNGDWVWAECRCVCGGPGCFERVAGAVEFLGLGAEPNQWDVRTHDGLFITVLPRYCRRMEDGDEMACTTGARCALGARPRSARPPMSDNARKQ